ARHWFSTLAPAGAARGRPTPARSAPSDFTRARCQEGESADDDRCLHGMHLLMPPERYANLRPSRGAEDAPPYFRCPTKRKWDQEFVADRHFGHERQCDSALSLFVPEGRSAVALDLREERPTRVADATTSRPLPPGFRTSRFRRWGTHAIHSVRPRRILRPTHVRRAPSHEHHEDNHDQASHGGDRELPAPREKPPLGAAVRNALGPTLFRPYGESARSHHRLPTG